MRNSVSGIGFDFPTALVKDNYGNIYITGTGSNDGINYDMKTTKITSSLSIAWTKTVDGYGKDDRANAICIDQNGDVIIGGYATKSNNVKELKLIKYNTQGIEKWTYEQFASDASGDAQIKAIKVGVNGQIYYLAEEKGKNGSIDVAISKISQTGDKNWEQMIATPTNDLVTGINLDKNGDIYVNSIIEATTNTYLLEKFTESEPSTDVVSDSLGNPLYNAHELIVRFKQNAINKISIDNKEIKFADLEYFLIPQAKYQVDTALDALCGGLGYSCPIKATKVFPQLYTTDTTTISRLGEVIKVPDFWTTLLLEFPPDKNLQQIFFAFKTIPEVIKYSELNLFAYLTGTPKYPEQHSLHNTTTNFAKANINVEQAWAISSGLPKVKCGVFDMGIDWVHKDFGYDGIDPNSLIDIHGKWLKHIFKGNSNLGETLVETNVDDLPSAMYLYEVKLGNQIFHIRFLKQ